MSWRCAWGNGWQLLSVALGLLTIPACLTSDWQSIDTGNSAEAPSLYHARPTQAAGLPVHPILISPYPAPLLPSSRPASNPQEAAAPATPTEYPPDPLSVAAYPMSTEIADPPALAADSKVEELLAIPRAYLEQQPEQAIPALSRHDPLTQDLLRMLMPVAVEALKGKLTSESSPEDLTLVVEQLNRVKQRLSRQANLTIPQMCFAAKIGSKYREYQPLPQNHLYSPGGLAELYVEVSNFKNEPVGDRPSAGREGLPEYQTQLQISSEIRDVTRPEQIAWRGQEPYQKRTRGERTELSLGYRIPVPMRPGRYWLRLRIVDVPTKRSAHKSIEFQVGSPRLPPMGD